MSYILPERVSDGINDSLLVLALVSALTASLLPKMPLGRVIRWLWRRNVAEPVSRWAHEVIKTTVEPMIAESRGEIMAASRQQHEAQNEKLDAIDDRVRKLERSPNARTRKTDG